jgi:hypothetical protein
MVDHFSDLGQDLVVLIIQFGEGVLFKIMVAKSNLDMDLWSVSAYLSSLGKFRLSSKIRITSDIAP